MKNSTKKKIIDFIKKLLRYDEPSVQSTHVLHNHLNTETFNIQELRFEGTFPEYCTARKGIIETEITKEFAKQLLQQKAFEMTLEIVSGWSHKEEDAIKVTAKMKYLTNYKKQQSNEPQH